MGVHDLLGHGTSPLDFRGRLSCHHWIMAFLPSIIPFMYPMRLLVARSVLRARNGMKGTLVLVTNTGTSRMIVFDPPLFLDLDVVFFLTFLVFFDTALFFVFLPFLETVFFLGAVTTKSYIKRVDDRIPSLKKGFI